MKATPANLTLINSKELFKAITRLKKYLLAEPCTRKYIEYGYYADDVLAAIDHAPAVDAVPVVHGHWEVVRVWKDNPQTTLKCSICKVYQPIYEHDEWLYCPFCGAKMDGGTEEG